MDAYISLPCARIHQNKKIKIFYNLPSDFEHTFYRDWLDGIDFSLDTDFQRNIVSQAPSEHVFCYFSARNKRIWGGNLGWNRSLRHKW